MYYQSEMKDCKELISCKYVTKISVELHVAPKVVVLQESIDIDTFFFLKRSSVEMPLGFSCHLSYS